MSTYEQMKSALSAAWYVLKRANVGEGLCIIAIGICAFVGAASIAAMIG